MLFRQEVWNIVGLNGIKIEPLLLVMVDREQHGEVKSTCRNLSDTCEDRLAVGEVAIAAKYVPCLLAAALLVLLLEDASDGIPPCKFHEHPVRLGVVDFNLAVGILLVSHHRATDDTASRKGFCSLGCGQIEHVGTWHLVLLDLAVVLVGLLELFKDCLEELVQVGRVRNIHFACSLVPCAPVLILDHIDEVRVTVQQVHDPPHHVTFHVFLLRVIEELLGLGR
mmetsp:Transcript_68388/g.160341  ORF Transcript_68388/g.160341 Transcript_68388/m.160341 type:complete len:224 (+) Transcript_68388:1757-2428(+)